MDTKQLFLALSQNKTTQPYFDGIYAKDTVSDIEGKPQLIVCNTDASHHSGTHWIAFFFENDTCEYFDSFGKPLLFYGQEFVEFVKNFATQFIASDKKVQSAKTATCGQYCLYFAFKKCKGHSLKKIVRNMPTSKEMLKYVQNKFHICKKSPSKFLMSCQKCAK
jgi:hypothetical protein